jgi:hypothetical protein
MATPTPPPGYVLESSPPPPEGYVIQNEKTKTSPEDLASQREQGYQTRMQEMVAQMPWYQKGLAGIGKSFVDTGRGIGQLLGTVTPQEVAQSRRQDEALMHSGAGRVGNILGYAAETAPLALVGGALAPAGAAARIGLGAAGGAAQGFISPYVNDRERTTNTLVGGALGGAIPAVGAGIKNALTGIATPEARELMAQGVKLTPGQMVGGVLKKVEDASTAIPITGTAIDNARKGSLESFNRSAVDQALSHIGTKLPKSVEAGRDALFYANKIISTAYNKTLSQMNGQLDQKFAKSLNELWTKYGSRLSNDGLDQLQKIMRNEVIDRFNPNGLLSGRDAKNIYSELGNIGTRMKADPNYQTRELGKAVTQLQNKVKDMLRRNSPEKFSDQLGKIDKAFMNMLPVNRAASSVGAKEGIVTAAQLKNSSRAVDRSRGKQAFMMGNAPQQRFAELGQGVLPSQVGSSGTAERLMNARLQGLVTGVATSPLAAIYTRPGLAVAKSILAPKESPIRNYLAQLAQSRLSNPANALMAPALMGQGPQQ